VTQQRYVYQDRYGVRRTVIVDDERPDRFVVHTEQDVGPLIDSVARDREIMRHDGVNKLVARLPVEVFERMIHEGWGPEDEARFLNSPEAAPYRVWRGRV
jgi:hypothetical protein